LLPASFAPPSTIDGFLTLSAFLVFRSAANAFLSSAIAVAFCLLSPVPQDTALLQHHRLPRWLCTYNDQDQGLLSLCPTLSALSLSDRLASPCCGHSPDKSVCYISFIQSIALDFLLLLRRLKVSTGRGRLAHRARCRSSPGNLVRPLVNRLGPDTVLRQQTRHLVAHHLDHGHLWLKRWWRNFDNLIYHKPHF
jgi:hypothetical protein